jgi:hypothetical protein
MQTKHLYNLPVKPFYCPEKMKMMWELQEDVCFTVNGISFTIKQGFIFDGATVPRYLWWLFNITGLAFFAACLHDWLYDTKGKGLYGELNLTRLEVDILFRDQVRQTIDDLLLTTKSERKKKLLKAARILQPRLMFAGVKFGGQKYWDNDSFPAYLV